MPYKDPEVQRQAVRELNSDERALARSAERRQQLTPIEARSLQDVRAAILTILNEVRSGATADLPRARFSINALAELRETFRVEGELALGEKLELIEQRIAELTTLQSAPQRGVEYLPAIVALPSKSERVG